jgi:hypothetical protein
MTKNKLFWISALVNDVKFLIHRLDKIITIHYIVAHNHDNEKKTIGGFRYVQTHLSDAGWLYDGGASLIGCRQSGKEFPIQLIPP